MFHCPRPSVAKRLGELDFVVMKKPRARRSLCARAGMEGGEQEQSSTLVLRGVASGGRKGRVNVVPRTMSGETVHDRKSSQDAHAFVARK
jgi:hypothetical protein